MVHMQLNMYRFLCDAAVSTRVNEKDVEIGMVDADGDFARVSIQICMQ